MRETVNKFQNEKAEQSDLLELKEKLYYDAPNMKEFKVLKERIKAETENQANNIQEISKLLEKNHESQKD